MTWVAVAVGGAALIGGIAGSMKDKSSASGSSGVNLAAESELEKYGGKLTQDNLKQLEGYVGAGPGQADVEAGYSSSKGLTSLLDDYARTGGVTQQDRLMATEDAKVMFDPQRTALNQTFDMEQQRAARLAAQLGRPINDPIIQAKLGQSRMYAEQQLAADQGAWQYGAAKQNSMNRLGFTGQAADVRSQLAAQAMQNRQALLSLGQGVQASERQWRYNISDKWGTQEQSSGGGTKGMLTGGLMGAGAGLGMAGSMQGMQMGQQQMKMNQNFMDSGMSHAQYFGAGTPSPAQPQFFAPPPQPVSRGVPSFLNPATGYGGGNSIFNPSWSPWGNR
jgi:hypothetical protein